MKNNYLYLLLILLCLFQKSEAKNEQDSASSIVSAVFYEGECEPQIEYDMSDNCSDSSFHTSFNQGSSFSRAPQIIEHQGNPLLFFTYGENATSSSNKNALVKYDNSGNLVWSKEYDTLIFQGGDDVVTTPDGSIFTLSGGITFGGSILRKSDALGNQIWVKEFDLPTPIVQFFTDMIPEENGGITLIGEQFSAGVFNRELLFLNLNSDGNVNYLKRIAVPNAVDLSPLALVKVPDGRYFIAAESDYDFVLVEISAAGDLLSSYIYDFRLRQSGCQLVLNEDQDGLYLIGERGDNITFANAFLAEIDFSGNVLRSADFSSDVRLRPSYISVFSSGELLLESQKFNIENNSVFLKIDSDWNVLQAFDFDDLNYNQAVNLYGKSHAVIENNIFRTSISINQPATNTIHLQSIPLSLQTECQSNVVDINVAFQSFSGQTLVLQNSTPLTETIDYPTQTNDLNLTEQVVCSAESTVPLTDLSVSIGEVFCQNANLFVEYQICNNGEETLPAGLPVFIYPEDPTQSITLVENSFNISEEIPTGECYAANISVEGYAQFYFLINADATQNTPLDLEDYESTFWEECDYENNLIGLDSIQNPPPRIGNQAFTFCEGDVFEFNDIEYTESVTVNQNTTTVDGCDSIIITELEMLPVIFTEEIQEYCEGEMATIFGENYTQDAIVSTIFTGQNGCDSTHTIDVIFNENIFEFFEFPVCEGSVVEVFGIPITESGLYSETYLSSNNCDSTVTITVSYIETIETTETLEFCTGEDALVFAEIYTADTIIAQTFTAFGGCDSTHTVTLFFLDTFQTEEILEACTGETIEVFDTAVSENITLLQIFTAQNGCDSVHQISVVFTENINTFEELFACTGDTLMVFGNQITTGETITETFVSAAGCDSTHQVSVSFLDALFTQEIQEYCEGETVEIFENSYTENVVTSAVFTAKNGCDSTHQVTLIFNENFNTEESFELCEGESLTVFGTEITSAQVLNQTFIANNGCDSTHTVTIVFFENDFTFETQEYCDGETAIIYGNAIIDNDVIIGNFTNENGCDSLHEITVIFNEEIVFYLEDTLCAGDTLTFNEQQISDTGTYEFTETGLGEDCDTTTYLTVNVLPEIDFFLPVDTLLPINVVWQIPLDVNADNLTFLWSPAEGLTCTDCQNPTIQINRSETYSVLITNELGCSQSGTININVDPLSAYFIPDVFSPNGDGNNDFFTVFGNEKLEVIQKMQIYDRWGSLIFSANDIPPNEPIFGWDGTFRGEKLNSGVFVYVVNLQFVDEETKMEVGDVLNLGVD